MTLFQFSIASTLTHRIAIQNLSELHDVAFGSVPGFQSGHRASQKPRNRPHLRIPSRTPGRPSTCTRKTFNTRSARTPVLPSSHSLSRPGSVKQITDNPGLYLAQTFILTHLRYPSVADRETREHSQACHVNDSQRRQEERDALRVCDGQAARNKHVPDCERMARRESCMRPVVASGIGRGACCVSRVKPRVLRVHDARWTGWTLPVRDAVAKVLRVIVAFALQLNVYEETRC